MQDISIALINPNTKAATTEMMVDIARGAAGRLRIGQCVSFEGHTAAAGPEMIISLNALARAATEVDKIASFLSRGSPGRPDALIVAAYGDPGLDLAEGYFPGRAFGIGTASMRAAAEGGRRFAVATTTPGLVPAIDERAQELGLTASYGGAFLTRTGPLELAADPVRQRDELADAVAMAIRIGGAEAVIIGGGPLAMAARQLASSVEVPLIEPIPAAVSAAVAAVVSATR